MDSIVEVKVKVYYKYILAQILLPKLLQHATSAAVSPKRPHHRYMHHGYIHHGYMHNGYMLGMAYTQHFKLIAKIQPAKLAAARLSGSIKTHQKWAIWL